MRFDHTAIEGLLDAVGGDEAELPGLSGAHGVGGDMPPVHDEIGGFGHLRPGGAHGLDIAIAQGAAHGGGADERRVADDEVGLGPGGLARLDVALDRHAGGLVGNLLAGDGAGLFTVAVPAGERAAGLVGDVFNAVVFDQGVAVLDVVEVAQDGVRQVGEALVDAVVPLQVADPQHHFGDGGGARVDLKAQKLVRVHGDAGHVEQALGLAKVGQKVEHLAFQALHVFQRHVQEVAAAAGGVEHAGVAELVVEAAHFFKGLVGPVLCAQGERGDLHGLPVAPQRLDEGGQDEPFDIGAGGVVGAELVALMGVECAFEQGAEDGGLDKAPVGA